MGTFLLRTPTLMIIDPQIVHEIFVTAFNYFADNDVGKLVSSEQITAFISLLFYICKYFLYKNILLGSETELLNTDTNNII